MSTPSLQFAAAARALGDAARGEGWTVPGFRSPPRSGDADRTLRRRDNGAALVSVRTRGRPWLAVLADMIEGVVVTNRLTGRDADRCRTALWSAVEARRLVEPPSEAAPGPGATVAPIARVA